MAHPRDVRIAELKAQIEAAKAEIAQIQADAQTEKAEDSFVEGFTDVKSSIAEWWDNRGLDGNRDADGTLITAKDQEARLDAQKEAGKIREDEIYKEMYPEEGVVKVPITKSNEEMDAQYMEEIKALDLKPNTPANEAHNKKVLHQMAENWSMGSFGNTPDGDEMLMPERKLVINSPEFQEIYGDAYDSIAAPLEVTITKGADEETTKGLPSSQEDDIEGDERTDAYSEKQKFIGIDREQGRAFAAQDDLPERSMGFKDKDGYMSVDEKDDFWKTQEGYDKAIEMYGSKPAWVKEPTLIWNPVEQKYEEIEEEEFEDLSRPAISADIKKLFG